MVTASQTFDLEKRLAETALAVDGLLDRVLADTPRHGEVVRPARLLEAMRHAVFAGGKRFRPFLLVEAANVCGRGGSGPLMAGCAVELLHTYSLIHDDLPSMDDDDIRRGKPTVHRAFDEATAILAGDALQSLAFDTLSRGEVDADPSVRVELVAILARAAGPGGMAGGQMLDLAAEAGRLDETAIRTMQSMKTGALIAAACEMGAVIAGAPPAARSALMDYGRDLGRA